MRAFINIWAPSLGEEGTKSIKDLKRQIVLMEKEKLFNEEEKNIFQRRFPKSLAKQERFSGCVSNKK